MLSDRRPLVYAVLAILASTSCGLPVAGPRASVPRHSLSSAFEEASIRNDVPVDVLRAVAFVESRWTSPGVTGGHEPTGPQVGPLGLRHGAGYDSLRRAGELLHVDESQLRANYDRSVDGAAAVLAEIGRRSGARANDVDSWAEAVATYSGIVGRAAQVSYARQVWQVLREGRHATAFTGETLLLPGRTGAAIEVLLDVSQAAQNTADYAPALWVPASSGNYTVGRGGNAITMVVIHTMEGSYAGSISWFQNPAAMAATQYCIRSSDGEVTQMVLDQDTAWQAGNWYYNQHSIGIEHEGYVSDPARWYTETMYVSSARLTRHLVDRYGIPIDRAHIVGHYQVPTSGSGAPCDVTATTCGGAGFHTDPGNGGTAWNWDHFMQLIQSGNPVMPMYDATLVGVNYPADMASGQQAVVWVKYGNTGTGTWDTVSTRIGTTQPRDRTSQLVESANWLSPNRPTAVDAPTAPGATGRFSFVIRAPTVATETVVTESFGLVQDTVGWFGPADDAVTFTIRVHPPGSWPVDGGTVDAPDASDALGDVDGDTGDAASEPGASGAQPGCACRAVGRRSKHTPSHRTGMLLALLGACGVVGRRVRASATRAE